MNELKLDKRALQYFAQAKLPKTFEIKASIGGKPAELLLYDAIGMDGITAQDVVESLSTISENEPLRVRVNSPGGSVFDGVAIHSALNTRPGDVEIVVDGVAASAASVIAMAGNRLLMQPASMMMIHNGWSVVVGSKEDLRQSADVLAQIDDTMAGIYAGQVGGSKDEWAAKMKAETWFTASEATQAGLAHGIVETAPKKKGIVAAIKSLMTGETSSNEVRKNADLSELDKAGIAEVRQQMGLDDLEAIASAPANTDYDVAAETERRLRLLRTVSE
jgi:ATP-dependent Clp protease protease subunit